MKAIAATILTLLLTHAAFATPADEAAKEGILLLGNGSEPHSLDPHINSSMNGHHVIMTLLEGLIAPSPTDDTIPLPGMAESWENEDFTKWTFKIRQNAKWSNGDPVTAHDFVYSFQRILSPRLGSQYAEMLFNLKNARAFNEGEISDFSEVGTKAIDNHTLTIELEGPIPYFLNILKHSSFFPVHKATVEKYGDMDDPTNNWIREEYVGNGPYVLKNWQMNQIIEVAKSPTYWDSKDVLLNGIKFFPIASENTEDQTFNSGNLHYTYTVPSDMIQVYQDRNDKTLHLDPFFGTYFYVLNNKVPPLDNPKVRQALSLAVNRNAIVRRITKGGQTPAEFFTPPGVAGYSPEPLVSFNPAKARELLAEAGYPNGEGFPTLTIKFNTLESHKAIAEAIQQMWKKILGIDVDIRNQEWKVYINSMQEGDFQIARYAWIGDYLHPDTFLRIMQSDSGQNDASYSNPEYDRLIAQSFIENSDEKRLELLAEAEKILLTDMPVIPIYHYTRVYRIDPRVKGWHSSPLDIRNYKGIYFEN
ncbi:peptide ABC transporter substrate-binding protein [Pelagicoccus sp. SDUM812002]|uniref:peptide ABC transporter substrate-binding protein n=1 Tax=Pelagicoccus sp. SDUM812002 TaxID=3041266 RepID=UPI002810E344|nr:peptide ABC transporter substrate-binding protein [Pelagicoccus sp. SDUM812002]